MVAWSCVNVLILNSMQLYVRDLCATCARPLSDLGLSYPSTLSCQGKLIVLFRLSPGPTLPHLVSNCGVRGWTPACSVSAACSNPGLRSHRRCLKSSWSHRMSGDHWGYSPFGVSGSAALSLLKSWVLLVHKWCELAEVWSATVLMPLLRACIYTQSADVVRLYARVSWIKVAHLPIKYDILRDTGQSPLIIV